MNRRALVACGIPASLLYTVADVTGARRWKGYRYNEQSVSELMAIGTPSRPLVLPIFKAHGALVTAFGVGVWRSAAGSRALRVCGASLVGVGVDGFVTGLWSPMHRREELRTTERTLTDTMHRVLTGSLVGFILLAVGSGAGAFGRRFRRYSIGTLPAMFAGAAATAAGVRRVEAQRPTPWVGITERINIYGYLLWLEVLAIGLLRRHRTR